MIGQGARWLPSAQSLLLWSVREVARTSVQVPAEPDPLGWRWWGDGRGLVAVAGLFPVSPVLWLQWTEQGRPADQAGRNAGVHGSTPSREAGLSLPLVTELLQVAIGSSQS